MASKMEGDQTACIAMLPAHGPHEAGGMATGQRFVNCQPQATTAVLGAGRLGRQKGSSHVVCKKAQKGPVASSVVPITGSIEADDGIGRQPG